MTGAATIPALLPDMADLPADPVDVSGCCWAIDRDEWEHPHFPTLAKAEAARARVAREDDCPDGPIYRLTAPCVEVACQCGAYELGEDEYPWGLHFADWSEAIDYAVSIGLNVTRTPSGSGYLVFDEIETWNQRGRGDHRWDCASLTVAGVS